MEFKIGNKVRLKPFKEYKESNVKFSGFDNLHRKYENNVFQIIGFSIRNRVEIIVEGKTRKVYKDRFIKNTISIPNKFFEL